MSESVIEAIDNSTVALALMAGILGEVSGIAGPAGPAGPDRTVILRQWVPLVPVASNAALVLPSAFSHMALVGAGLVVSVGIVYVRTGLHDAVNNKWQVDFNTSQTAGGTPGGVFATLEAIAGPTGIPGWAAQAITFPHVGFTATGAVFTTVSKIGSPGPMYLVPFIELAFEEAR